jgi:hypothetical protein
MIAIIDRKGPKQKNAFLVADLVYYLWHKQQIL